MLTKREDRIILPWNHLSLSDLICPKPFNGGQGLVGQPKHRQGSCNMGPDEERIARTIRKKRRQRTLFWMLIITLISLVFSTLIGNMDVYIAKFAKVSVDSYRPMDTERRLYELEKEKNALEKEKNELKKERPVHKK
jgi:cell division protein FtsB